MAGPIVTYELRDEEDKPNPLVRRNFADLINFLTLRNNGTTEWNNLFVGNELATTEVRINNSASDGDPILTFQLSGTTKFAQGVDDGDSDVWKMGTTAIGTATMMEFTATGQLTLNALSSAGFVKNTAEGVISGGNSVDISSDTNLVGGEGIDLSGDTLVLNLNEITTDTSIASGDLIAFTDITDSGNQNITFANFESTLNHDSLAGFVADEHIAHAGVTLTAQDGITGGGTIAASRTFGLGGTLTADVSIDTEGNTLTLTHDGTENNLLQVENSGTTGDAFSLYTASSTNASFGLNNGTNRISLTIAANLDSAGIFTAGTTDMTLGSGIDFFSTIFTDYSATSTIVGWSSFSIKQIFYKEIGNMVFIWFNLTGTSNSTTSSFTMPFTNTTSVGNMTAIQVTDNGTGLIGRIEIPANSATANAGIDGAGSAFTNSGTKRIFGHFFFEHT